MHAKMGTNCWRPWTRLQQPLAWGGGPRLSQLVLSIAGSITILCRRVDQPRRERQGESVTGLAAAGGAHSGGDAFCLSGDKVARARMA